MKVDILSCSRKKKIYFISGPYVSLSLDSVGCPRMTVHEGWIRGLDVAPDRHDWLIIFKFVHIRWRRTE
jgi:hypothetical protein